MFTDQDIDFIESKGIDLEVVNTQLENFRRGFPFISIDRAAVVGDGIVSITSEEAVELAGNYDEILKKGGLECIKFVPASGAATRMFKDLYDFLDTGRSNRTTRQVLENITKFAFYDDLQKLGVDFSQPHAVISTIVKDGLEYGSLPKGLIKFHNDDGEARTAIEEHLVKGAMYASVKDMPVRIHFTVSPEHLGKFREVVDSRKKKYEERFGTTFDVTYSVQKSSTDTIAVYPDNKPFREKDGSLLFRPAGHGALIGNLNELDADLIFIKNIDNIVPDRIKGDTILYRKALAAIALDTQKRIFGYINDIDRGKADSGKIKEFIETKLGYKFSNQPSVGELRAILNRPLRVCGMVRNYGEPGGGPFWVSDDDGSLSLQIVESPQISTERSYLMKQATHFNPVDIVCAVRDVRGQKFDLLRYVNPQTGFISVKSKDGRVLKAQELPGLWNGAMAYWNTIFVEVPVSTFAPVKTISDLLRPEHI